MPTIYQDGNWSTGFEIGADLVTFPFGQYPTPDAYQRNTSRNFAQNPNTFSPQIGTRTNYTSNVTYSEVLTNGAWTATALSVTDNQLANPADGQVTMSKCLETAANSEHRVAQAVTFTATSWTLSAIVAGGLGRTWVYLRANDGTNSFSGYFNIGTGVVGTLSNATGAIVPLNQGTTYYRVSITFTPAAASGNIYVNVASDGSTISYAGDTAKGLYVWGVQAGAGTAGPYIPTTNVARTVNAPVVDSERSTASTSDPGDPFAYLVEESPMTISDMALARYTRTWARVPKQQVVPSSYLFTAPNLPPQSLGGVTGLNTSVTNYSVPQGAAQQVGNYAYISVEGLSSWSGYYSAEGSFTNSSPNYVISGLSVNVNDKVVFYESSVGTYGPATYGVVNTVSGSNVTLTNVTTFGAQASPNIYVGAAVASAVMSASGKFRKLTKTTCDLGQTYNLPANQYENYYLPNVTPGITNANSITLQGPYTFENYLGAWAGNATWFNVQASQLSPWMGPILKETYTQAKLQ